MSEYIEDYCISLLNEKVEGAIWVGELIDFNRGVIYLTTKNHIYKADFHGPPIYHRMIARKLKLQFNTIDYPYVINCVCNSSLIEKIKNKVMEAKHLDLSHFVIVTQNQFIDIIAEKAPSISLIKNQSEEALWKI